MTANARAAAAAIDAALLVTLKAALGAFVLAIGFSHVSDDDYARVVIAELFAHAPKLDPSGTSWLPFPFWLDGTAMILFGRSLATARAAAFVIGALSVVPPYLALRAVRVPRTHAWIGVAVGAFAPWSAWLAVSTVPEALTASLVAAGAIAIGAPRWRPLAAAGLLAAALSRYEAWPVCAVFAAACAWSALRSRGARSRAIDGASAIVAIAGPLAWMAWNAHAHGSALHFFARVSAYRQAIGAASVPLSEKWLDYPRALVTSAPEIVALAALGACGLGDRELRARWAWPLVAGGALLAFLVYGDLRDGAPTHHAERPLLALTTILAAFGVDGARAWATRTAWARPKREMWVVGAAAAALIAWGASLPARLRAYPGGDVGSDRSSQLARGAALREERPRALSVTPCAYEHFALLAALGAPEIAVIAPSTREPPTASCPRVVVR